jgi:uncharacterized phage protein (TIGR01671 family)
MRKIKFRAWEKPITKFGFGRMYCPAFPTWNGDIEVWRNNSPQTETELLSPMCGSEPILMQCTGLKDKNGKEIYEGDILRLWRSKGVKGQLRGEYAYPLPVEYCETWAQFVVVDKANKVQIGIWQDFEVYEVIGNIYENPELLGGE